MYNKKYRKSNGDKDIFDDIEKIGRLTIRAHDKGGMPLVLALVGVISLLITAYLVFASIFNIWTIIFIVLALLLFICAIYFYVHKKKEVCPKCGSQLIVKSGRYGKFLGCSNYPKCDFTKNIFYKD